MSTQLDYTRFPRVPLGRRSVAFSIDFFGVWLLSSLLGGNRPGFEFAQVVVFVLAWVSLRVLLVSKNQGQSLGRYALDMKVLDAKLGRVPGLQALFQREAVTGCCALLVAIAFNNIATVAILLMLPLLIDCGIALADTTRRQAVHDRIARTVIVSSRRGYSVDLKIKRVLAQMRHHMRK